MKGRRLAWSVPLQLIWLLSACSNFLEPDQRATRAYNNFVGDVDVLIGKLEGSQGQIEFNNHIISNGNELNESAEKFYSTIASIDEIDPTSYQELSSIALQGLKAGNTWQSLALQLSACDKLDLDCQQLAFDSNLDFAPGLDKLLKDMTKYSTTPK